MHVPVTDQSTPNRRTPGLVLAVAALALGASLIVLPLSLPVIATLAGAGLVVVGLATLLGTDGTEHAREGARAVAGLVGLAAGVVVVAWQTASIRTLVYVIVAALIVHGAHTMLAAVRGDSDRRLAGLFSGAAIVVFGVLCLVWPVVAVTLVKLGVGAWLVFVVAAGLAMGSAILLHGDDRPDPGGFYTPSAAVPPEHGQLIRAETLATGAPDGADAWRILYSSTDEDGGPAVVCDRARRPDRSPHR